jgi:hypothetical protein
MPIIHLDSDKEAKVSRQQLLEAAAAMPSPELDQFIDELMTARARQYAPSLPAEEAALLERINRCGLSPSGWERFHDLLARRQVEAITEAERSELLQLVDRLEELNAERIEALARLSKLRGVPLPELMETLGIKSPGYV